MATIQLQDIYDDFREDCEIGEELEYLKSHGATAGDTYTEEVLAAC